MSRSPDQPLLRRTRRRLIAWSAGSTLVALLLLSATIYAVVAASLADASIAQLKLRAQTMAAGLQTAGAPQDVFSTQLVSDPASPGMVIGGDASGTIGLVMYAFPDAAGFGVGPGADGVIADREGPGSLVSGGSMQVSATTDGGPVTATVGVPGRPETVSEPPPHPFGDVDLAGFAAAREGRESVNEASLAGTPIRVLTTAIPVGDTTVIVQVLGDRTAEERTLRVLLLVLLVGSVAVLLAALAVGWVYAGRALVPIRESLKRQREFVADASHELRTPLTTVRAGVEHLRRNPSATVGSMDGVVDDVDAELRRVSAMVDDLLLLARTDSGGLDVERRPVDLDELAVDAVEGLATISRERHATVELDVTPVALSGDPTRLRQLIGLLLDNALRHGPEGQVVTVRVRTTAGDAVVDVEDQGPGVRAADLPHIFERFYRAADAPPGGAGLGLAIARWIAERHGGSLRVENLARGGARFSASLPLA